VSRIVRECLTNAGRHAPGESVTLSVAWSPAGVCVTSTNPAGTRGAKDGVRPGRGLTGIRHRAELLGGSYQACAGEGRFEVRVSLPAPPAAQPTAGPRGAALVAGEPQ
jgi:signal transduction histidine kinase